MLSWFKISSFFILLTSIILGVSASSSVMIWVSLEINLLGFLMWLVSWEEEDSVKIKYFVIQSVGAIMIFSGVIMFNMVGAMGVLSELGLILKLGLAPFHSWFINLVLMIKKNSLFILMTLQKVLPLYFLMIISEFKQMFPFFMLCVVLGTMGGLSQLCWKKIMGYSSVFTGSWFMLNFSSLSSLFIFFMVYSISVFVVVSLLFLSEKTNQFYIQVNFSKSDLMILMLGFLSMAGVPPLLGFFGKTMLLIMGSEMISELVLALILITSIVFTYIYVRLIYSNLSSSSISALYKAQFYSSGVWWVVLLLGGLMIFFLCVGVTTLSFDLKENN